MVATDSGKFIGLTAPKLVRCLGKLKRVVDEGWVLHLLQIRESDWEEVEWTKRIITGDAKDKDSGEEDES